MNVEQDSGNGGGGIEHDSEWIDVAGSGADDVVSHALWDLLVARENGRFLRRVRTWKEHREHETASWEAVLDEVSEAYIQYMYCSRLSAKDPSTTTTSTPPVTDPLIPAPNSTSIPDAADPPLYEYTVRQHVTIHQSPDSLSPAIDLMRHGYLAKTPSSPTVAVSLSTLRLFHHLRLRKPSFSFEALTRVLCDYYCVPYRRHLRHIVNDAFVVYLLILHRVQKQVDKELGWDGPNFRVLNACSACCYELLDEPPMKFSRLWCHDGNNSLKRMLPFNNRAASETRLLEDSDYFLPRDFVNNIRKNLIFLILPIRFFLMKYASEVRSRSNACDNKWDTVDDEVSEPRAQADEEGDPTDGGDHTQGSGIDECVKNWKAAAADEKKRTWAIFDETGVFVSACRHSLTLWIADMVRSGELAKYPLATLAKSFKVLKPNACSAMDINCAFETTVKHSSLASAALEVKHTFCVNAFHGYSHNYLCQLKNHPNVVEGVGLEDFETLERMFSSSNQLASVTRYASPFRRQLLIETYFKQWDEDKYANLGLFILNNYKQALDVLSRDAPALDEAKQKFSVTNAVLDKWEHEQQAYFATLDEEPAYDVQRVAYVELLQSLNAAENDVKTPGTSYGQSAAATRRTETKRRQALEHRDRILADVIEFEGVMGITTRWFPGHPEYQEAAKYIAERKYRQALYKVQQLVVQRLFELHKLNVAGTGYKLRTQIAKSLQTRSKAIRRAIKMYNDAATALGKPPLDWSHLSGLNFLEELLLLKGTKNDISEKEWNRPVFREIIKLRKRVARANEEILRCNVESRRLFTCILDEEDLFCSTLSRLRAEGSVLLGAVKDFITRRRRINHSLLSRIYQIFLLPGFSGNKTRGVAINPRTTSSTATGPADVSDLAEQHDDPDDGDDGDEDEVQADMEVLIEFFANTL
ncbi:hypothetical protein K474DRAFT_1685473 [Panus rudis PR-1116 ss-1]|nr:hypothetical protein K474DRAFT_1685473 [Panus rudis PR-1116 ss-1]